MYSGDGTKEYDVWLGVKLRTEALSGHEATRRAVECLAEALRACADDGTRVLAGPVDLVEPVVRALQQMGAEGRLRSQEGEEAQPTPVPVATEPP